MKTQVAMCRCGQQVKKIDVAKGFGICEYCDSLVFLKRDEILTSDVAKNNRDLAVKCFKEKDIKGAAKYAEEVLKYVPNNAIGLFITAFYQSYMAEKKNKDALKNFFANNVLGALVNEEQKQVLILTRLVLPYLVDYESQVIKYALTTDDKALAGSFFEGFLPSVIARRVGSTWLDNDLKDRYMRIAKEFDTPKTMFALYKSMTDNVNSPERKENYGMLSVMKNFIDGFCKDLGDIFAEITNPSSKEKFVKAYRVKLNAYNKIYQSESERIRKFKNGF